MTSLARGDRSVYYTEKTGFTEQHSKRLSLTTITQQKRRENMPLDAFE